MSRQQQQQYVPGTSRIVLVRIAWCLDIYLVYTGYVICIICRERLKVSPVRFFYRVDDTGGRTLYPAVPFPLQGPCIDSAGLLLIYVRRTAAGLSS